MHSRNVYWFEEQEEEEEDLLRNTINLDGWHFPKFFVNVLRFDEILHKNIYQRFNGKLFKWRPYSR